MKEVCAASSEPLRAPRSPAQRDNHPPATADGTDRSREVNAADQDIKTPAEEAKAAALRAPARVKRANGGSPDVFRALENRHRWLLFAQHCYTCTRPEDECELGKLCTYGKKTLKHVAQCKRDDCSYPRCRLLKPLLQHSRKCQSSTCAICVPVWNYIQKDAAAQQQQQPPDAPSQQQQQTEQHRLDAASAGQVPQHPSASQPHPPSHKPSHAVSAGTRGDAGVTASTTTSAVTIGGHVRAASGEPPSRGGPAAALAAAGVVTGGLGHRADVGLGRGDNAEGLASMSGTGGDGGRGVPLEMDGRLSSTGTPGMAGSAVSGGGSGGPAAGRGELGLAGKLAQGDGIAEALHQRALHPPNSAPYGAAAGAAGPASLGSHRYVGVASAAAPPSYTLSPYGAAVTAAGAMDGAERPKGVTITATPPQPISIASRAAAVPGGAAAAAPQGPQIIHSYPPSTSIGAFFPSHLAHHPHSQPPAAAGSSAAVAAHWLPLQGLAAIPSGGVVNGASPILGGGGGGGGGPNGILGPAGVATGSGVPATQPPHHPSAVWSNPAAVRSGHVTVYGIPPDMTRPNGIAGAAAVPAPAEALQGMERFGRSSYSLPAGVNGTNGVPAGGPLAMTAAPVLLWPPGHPSTAAGAPSGPQGHIPTHLTAPYSVTANPGGARLSSGAPALGVGGHGAAAIQSAPAAIVQAPQLSTHALIYGHTPALAPAPNTGGGGAPGAAQAGGLPSGAALWSYVLR